LRKLATKFFELPQLVFGFHTFSDDPKAETMGKHHHGGNNLPIVVDVHV